MALIMFKYITTFTIAILLSISGIAQASPHRNPVRDVKNELERSYKIYPREEYIHCHRLTSNRYMCSWKSAMSSNMVNGCFSPKGTASVVYYRYGPEIDIRFSGQYQYCTYPY
jgi:hypothetical protein